MVNKHIKEQNMPLFLVRLSSFKRDQSGWFQISLQGVILFMLVAHSNFDTV